MAKTAWKEKEMRVIISFEYDPDVLLGTGLISEIVGKLRLEENVDNIDVTINEEVRQ